MTLKEWYIRIKNKLIYSIGVHFPYSKVRVRSLRALGWRVGKNVYFPADLVITQNFVYYRGELEIGDNAWLGAGCIVLPGVTIGANAVVSAFFEGNVVSDAGELKIIK